MSHQVTGALKLHCFFRCSYCEHARDTYLLFSYLSRPYDTSSTMATSLNTTVYTAVELKESPNILQDVLRVINLAFTERESLGFKGPRFANHDQLLKMLGPAGLCAVVRSQHIILAACSVIPWRPHEDGVVNKAMKETRPNNFVLVEKGLSYEVKAVATANAPESRGRGLVGMCVRELVSRLFVRHPGESTLLLWIQLAEDQSGPYWRKRGYEQVGHTEMMPKGTWESTRDFQFSTLVKRVGRQAHGEET